MLLLAALLASSPVPVESRQLVFSVSDGWDAPRARVRLYERDRPATPWRPVGIPMLASLGRTGLAWGRGLHPEGLDGPLKKEGDGKSPAGVFELREATGYPALLPETHLRYRQATETLKCVDDPASGSYNQLVDATRVAKDWTSAEDMRRDDILYRLVVWVGHNDRPVAKGAGSCIFLHLRDRADAVTAGCTALDAEPMDRLMRFLDPALRPVLVQLPSGAFHALGKEWGLPAQAP
jgi:L,D-peptidoglycan transpeptidase YkuD (ErfK/YbiS/YcfS/YnhG family)